MASILIVDDSPSMRRMVGFTLTEAGHDITEAADGEQALAAAARAPGDLVLTDLNMPGMGGLELIARLRAMPEYRRIPILILTTESSDGMKEQAKAAGADGWIVKPFNPERLIAVVDKVLRRASGGDVTAVTRRRQAN